jgi:hypothetical protein
MAKAYLRSYRGREIDNLPPVCMVCGEPAKVRKSKQFSWQPPWVPVLILGGLLPYLIVSIVLKKRQSVVMQMCERHLSYFWLFPTLVLLSLFGILGAGLLLLITVLNVSPAIGLDKDGAACFVGLGTFGFFLIWLIAFAILNQMRIRPSEITDRHIELTNVSQAFADAVEGEEPRERREFGREFDEEPRRRFRDDRPRRPRDDDERYYGEDERHERG